MRQRRTVITLALIAAILGLGIAYAAISNQTLTVTGNAAGTTSDANFKVEFTGTPTTGGSGTTIATIDSTNSKKATINVSGLTTANQTATATYTIKNSSPADVSAALTAAVSHTNSTWFDVTTSIANPTLAQNGTTTITVTVKLKDTSATDADVTAAKDTITVTITAVAK